MKRFLEYVLFVLRSKGISKVIPRVAMLCARFDLSGRKMATAVAGIDALGGKFGFRPAMIVPAVVLQRHKRLLRYATDSHLEFAIHGNTHKNHRPWSLEKQTAELERAKAIFESMGMPYCGFRAPYLSCNAHTNDALEKAGLLWNSDQAIMWPSDAGYEREQGYHLKGAIEFLYAPADAAETLAMPRMHGQLVCIPLVFPDDEQLVDRLSIHDPQRIAEIWIDVLHHVHARGEVFVLQFHPERYSFCARAMEALLETIETNHMPVWVADMCEIARWWRERSAFTFTFDKLSDDEFEITCECTSRAIVLARNGPDRASPFRQSYQCVAERRFRVNSDGVKPCIGIDPQCAPELKQFVAELGFAYEISADSAAYGFAFRRDEAYAVDMETDILARIEACHQPLLRYWLWPDGFESAFATSHDLDCVTLTDFAHRAMGR